MNAASVVDKQISDYLVQLNIVQKKAVLNMLKAFTTEDTNYEKEMNKRFEELENDTVKGYTWDEAISHARVAYKSSKKKK